MLTMTTAFGGPLESAQLDRGVVGDERGEIKRTDCTDWTGPRRGNSLISLRGEGVV